MLTGYKDTISFRGLLPSVTQESVTLQESAELQEISVSFFCQDLFSCK